MKDLRQRFSIAALLLAAASPGIAAEAFPGPTAVQPLLIGSEVPSVEVLGLDGSPVDLHEVVGTGDAVVIFYRGGW